MTKNALALLLLASAALPALADVAFPNPDDAVARQLIERYRKDLPMLKSADLLKAPAPAPEWPCEMDQKELYKAAGLAMADPDFKKDMDKQVRKLTREMGVALPASEQKYSNIKIIPLVAHCENGKLEGELQLLVSYTMDTETKMTTMMGEKAVNMITNMHSDNTNRIYRTMQAGVAGPDSMMVFDGMSSSSTTADDPAMASALAKNKMAPIHTRNVSYTLGSGHTAMFSDMNETKISSGFLAPSVKSIPALQTTFSIPSGDKRVRSLSYTNAHLTMSTQMKDGKQHGEAIMYMDNFYKAMGQKLDRQPGMENARAVTIDGLDLIETRTCYQNGVVVKTAECPSE